MSKPRPSPVPSAATAAAAPPGESVRESVEAVIVAIILTLTFRTFLGENYQIPTGSMAPTLQGRHMDVMCPECAYQYRTGASMENEEDGVARGEVTVTTCPICRYRLELDKKSDLNQRSFGGDRIIVSKLAYLFHEPSRWDVFVFKYPGNPKINYIKRLVGLPGETLRIRHGDLFILDPATAAQPAEQQRFVIARKPAETVAGMLQLVDDTYHLGTFLKEVGWPSRWGPVQATDAAWQSPSDGVQTVQPTPEVSWLGYRHMIPRDQDWHAIRQGGRPELAGYSGQLITDYYEYNDLYNFRYSSTSALNWVGDLAVDAQIEVLSDSGELLFDIIEGGIHHQCRIDIATGRATLQLDGGQRNFRDLSGREARESTGQTAIRGRGNYELRFANVDDQLFLWVHQKPVSFADPTTFDSPSDLAPKSTAQDPGDLVPLRVGARQTEMRVSRLRVYRDVYYGAAKFDDDIADSDYEGSWTHRPDAIADVLASPATWSTTDLFAGRREVTYTLGPDQFFPMGDNSPQSKDGRLWSRITRNGLEPPPYVVREMLIGKAVFVYWPHGWRILTDWVGIIPNFQRIGRIR